MTLRGLVSAVAMVTFVSQLAACGGPMEPATPHAAFDGQTLFEGLMFGTGPAAQELPEVWGKSPARQALEQRLREAPPEEVAASLDTAAAQLRSAGYAELASKIEARAELVRSGDPAAFQAASEAEQQATEQAVVARISKDDPTFFAAFAADLQSGDQVRVDRGLRSAAQHLLSASTRANGTSDDGRGQGLYGWWYRDAYVAAAVVAVVAVAIAAIEVAYAPGQSGAVPAWAAPGKDTDDLDYQVLVNNLTERLAPQH